MTMHRSIAIALLVLLYAGALFVGWGLGWYFRHLDAVGAATSAMGVSLMAVEAILVVGIAVVHLLLARTPSTK
jgi:hypothetical protein